MCHCSQKIDHLFPRYGFVMFASTMRKKGRLFLDMADTEFPRAPENSSGIGASKSGAR